MADLFYVSSIPVTGSPYSSASLIALVRDFERDANTHRKLIQEIQQYQPESFYSTTIQILRKGMDSPGAKFLISLLVARRLLFRALCDRALDREQALALARHAIHVDPAADAALAHQLADSAGAGPDFSSRGEAGRLMEILSEISGGPRLLPSLMRILRIANPYLRSKAVLMIGRGNRSVKWARSRLSESDPRIRANAVEALWSTDTEEARELLEFASHDSNNRVAGNAVLGLYRMGEVSTLTELVKMAAHSSVSFRTTAAWVMGETGDPRFSEILARMLADSAKAVRTKAFVAVGTVRTAVAQVSRADQWRVVGLCRPQDPRTGRRRIQVTTVTAEGSETPRVLPVQFILSEDGQPVWSYEVVEKPASEPLSVVFLLPRGGTHDRAPWNRGALRCLSLKRPIDLWSAVPYFSPRNLPTEIYPNQEMPVFTANPIVVAAAFQQIPKACDCSLFWDAVERSIQPGNVPLRGQRHLIVLAPAEIGEPAADSLIAAVHASRTSVRVVSTGPNPALQEFCSRTGGYFLPAKNEPNAIEDCVSLAYLNLLSRYEIRYQPVCPDAASLKIRVHTPEGWGETAVALSLTG
jgi:hypothetical protein